MRGDLKRNRKLVDCLVASIRKIPIRKLDVVCARIESNILSYKVKFEIVKEDYKVFEDDRGRVIIGLDLSGFRVKEVDLDNFSQILPFKSYLEHIGKGDVWDKNDGYARFVRKICTRIVWASSGSERDAKELFLSSDYSKPVRDFIDSLKDMSKFRIRSDSFKSQQNRYILPLMIVDFDRDKVRVYQNYDSQEEAKCCRSYNLHSGSDNKLVGFSKSAYLIPAVCLLEYKNG